MEHDMTDNQIAIVQAVVDKGQHATDAEIADMVDLSGGYVNKVRNEYEDLIEQEIGEDNGVVRDRIEDYDEDEINKHRNFNSLTDKQKRTVHSIVALGGSASFVEIAVDAGVSDSYVGYVLDNFPHIVNKRLGDKEVQKAMADGGEKVFTIRLPEGQAWKAVRALPDELSADIFEQITDQ